MAEMVLTGILFLSFVTPEDVGDDYVERLFQRTRKLVPRLPAAGARGT
jgi:hypothetical protein